MFSPIIHNLPEWHPAYNACQHYNALIANKPKGNDMTLDQKIEALRLWKAQCQDALGEVVRFRKNSAENEFINPMIEGK